MGYWSQQCERAQAISPEMGAVMPSNLTLKQIDELALGLPAELRAFLEERKCLVWNVLIGDDVYSEIPNLTAEKRMEWVIDHKAVHILHRDDVARFVCAREPRPDTYVLHPDAFPQAHRAGLIELTRIPFLRPAIEQAKDQFLNREAGSEIDYSIFLARSVGQVLTRLQLSPLEERRILEAYQSAVLGEAHTQVYRHSHHAPKSAPVKQALLLEKHVPHFKRISLSTDLARPDSSVWVENIENG